MLFNSYEFILVFWPLCWVVWYFLQRHRPRLTCTWLVIASWFFYAWWRPDDVTVIGQYLPLLAGSGLFNFWLGRRIASGSGRGALAFGVAANLALLGYFKYAAFFSENVGRLLGLDRQIEPITLPIAISFFTFQQIAYLADCATDRKYEAGFSRYTFFVSFFPQLIAGPIVHHREIFSQIDDQALKHRSSNLSIGLLVFALGLFKKVYIADSMTFQVQAIYDLPGIPGFYDAWGATLSYALQIYFDFSGYADMAIGIALTFGIRLPENFLSPYKATSIIDFWRRWHMTLSRFLRDYVYIPLGGSRKGVGRRYLNLLVTMLLGGLWHGANWTFVVWGALHGLYLTVNHLWRRMHIPCPVILGRVLTLIAVLVAWVLFRANDLGRAGDLLQSMAGLHGARFGADEFSFSTKDLLGLTPWLAIALFGPDRGQLVEWLQLRPKLLLVMFILIGVAAVLSLPNPSPFLYFQF